MSQPPGGMHWASTGSHRESTGKRWETTGRHWGDTGCSWERAGQGPGLTGVGWEGWEATGVNRDGLGSRRGTPESDSEPAGRVSIVIGSMGAAQGCGKLRSRMVGCSKNAE